MLNCFSSRRMCWRVYKVHNVVYWANSKVNHLISQDFKRICWTQPGLAKCCLSENDIFSSEKDWENRLLGYIWKVTHLQYFQSLSPQILTATDQFTPFKAKQKVVRVIRSPRSPMCGRIKSRKKLFVEIWIAQSRIHSVHLKAIQNATHPQL